MPDIRFAVKRYLDDGRIVLPVKSGEKATRLKRWSEEDTRPTTDDFQEEDNVAFRLDTFVDVDCDCAEARAVAPALLLRTDMRHARPSRGVTHYWYLAEGVEDLAFRDVDGSSIIEIRTGRKQYTLVPPSRVLITKGTPEDGTEELYWDHEKGQPAHVLGDGVIASVRSVATASLIIRHWPKSNRHNLLVALAGVLSRYGVEEREAIEILKEITRVAEGEVWQDCDPAVRDSYAKLESGKTTGAPALEAILGKDVVRLLLKWYSGSGINTAIGSGLPQPLTEAGDAECFADMYRDVIRYDHRQGRWLVIDPVSGIWMPDPIKKLTQMTVEMMRARQKAAIDLEGEKKKHAIRWAIQGESRTRIMNAQSLAQSVPPIADSGEHWDEDPFLLGAQNGVIDLRTATFRQALPEERITLRVRVPFDAEAACPLWMRTLDGIFAGDQAIIAFMQRALGYSITGDCREECCFFTWGDGCNGKGTLMNTLGWLFMDYTDDMPYSTLERSDRGSGIPNDVAKLDRKRFITCAEVNEFNLNEARLKALTGRDPITARFLNKEFFTFTPVCKIWIATNNKPKITGQDDGIWRRIHLIPFTQQFTGRENKRLKDELRVELPGILNWVVAGSRAWVDEGLNPPDSVKAATATYRQESNPITPFIDASCVQGDGLSMRAGEAYKAYEEFCHQKSIDSWMRLSEKSFHKAMRQAFKVNTGRHVLYVSVGLKVSGGEGRDLGPTEGPPF